MSDSLTFNPSPDLAAAAITRLTDPARSFNDIARELNCSPEALSLWMSRPEIVERLDALDTSTIVHTRLVAHFSLSKSVDILSRVCDRARLELERDGEDDKRLIAQRAQSPSATSTLAAAALPGAPPAAPVSRSPELRLRTLETARHAATRLFQLARFNPPSLFTRTLHPSARVERSMEPACAAPIHAVIPAPAPQPTSPAATLVSPSVAAPPSVAPVATPSRSSTPISAPRPAPLHRAPHHSRAPALLAGSAGTSSALQSPQRPGEHWP